MPLVGTIGDERINSDRLQPFQIFQIGTTAIHSRLPWHKKIFQSVIVVH
jgi:hypothetical protein